MLDGLPYSYIGYSHNDLEESALSLAKWGYRVFPVHWAEIGSCSCRLGRSCGSTAKHPLTPRGLRDATDDREQIKAWWSRWPKANIGLCTGDGLVVIDIDGPEGEAEAAKLDLPTTVASRTGKGRHLFYEGESGNRVRIRPGIDIRGAGGYVIAPPSVHASGTAYAWINGPDDHDFAPLPAWVTERAGPKKTERVSASRPIERRPIKKGERNVALFRFASLLRSVGAHEYEIGAAIDARNLDCCDPPLGIEGIATIARSAAQHPGAYLSDRTLLQTGITPHTLVIYLAIRARADHQGICIAGYDTLAEDANVGVSRVKSKAIPELEELGLVHVTRPGPLKLREPLRANEYLLLDPEEQSTATANADGPTAGDEDEHRS